MPVLGVGTHPDPDLTAPYFVEALSGLAEGLPGWAVKVNPTGIVDAWVLLAPTGRPGGIPPETPVVSVSGALAGWPSIEVDNVLAAASMAEFLWSRGHRRFGFVGGKREMSDARAREQGFREALMRRGAWNDAWVWDGRFDRASGRAAGDAWLASMERPTAVFAANDHMALGVMDAARARGARWAVAGFDDIPEAEAAGLTTVRVPIRAMARRAGEWVFRWQRSGRSSVPDKELFTAERVERESTHFTPAVEGRA